ncbi:peptidase C14, caspase catalytic subunit p20 [Nostoc sp. 'Peltigera membranacea cyanobiont' 213]|uniref:caspase family protein n=1 Tax=Nostoc sp. 'Peltigera membranacea cyanobiont' 213 TaxID=2014530 RepID=UPI000B956C63|nr:caspase family protein [Nostoc sp. 'Peltigera membranacea cyanobiont' 213]OYD94977.1 peptidase C14, caspase catalytic subunit p20 [Nostoc sp. 'Peltigera membranacea cyanobiont' 213]
MSDIKRRHFLQFCASTLATLGLSQLEFMQQGERISQALAQNAPRKLALLVGINEYSGTIPALKGCVNDVLLQKQLLIYRFGFKSEDIRILTDKQATRQGILTAFEEHLIKQAKPGDVVVFHFSGHGSQVEDRDRDSPDGLNSTFVPIDSQLPQGYPAVGGAVQDITGHTLFLLMSALKTDNVTVVLDSCHSGGGTRGNLRVRSRNGGTLLQPSQAELDYQQQWLGKLGLSQQQFIELRRKNVAKGVVIASAKREQYAADAAFDDFYAGAFTYIFTQYLWQQTGNEPVNRAIVNVARNTKILAREQGNFQEPELETNFSKENTNAPIYFSRFSSLPAEAVVTQVNGDQVKLWLGGTDSQSLEAFKKDMILTVLDPQGGERGLVKLGDRQGLIASGKLLSNTRAQLQIQPGTLLQERIRSIPSDLTLKIGLDNSLDRNTSQQAAQALRSINRIEPKPLGTLEVQYIFGCITEAKHQELQKQRIANLPSLGSFGLFLPSQDQIVPASFGSSTEAVSEAVKRLQPKLKSLLAARIVKQILGNTNTSQIAITASMNIAGNNELLGETFTIRGAVKKEAGETKKPAPVQVIKSSDSGVAKLPIGTTINFQIQNNESSPLYVSILVIDAQGEMTVIFPNDWSASEDAALVEAKQKRVIPQADDGFKLTIGDPLGLSEALIVASTTPLRTSLKALQTIAKARGLENRNAPVALPDEVLDVTNSLLFDLDAGTRGGIKVEGIALPDGVRGIDTKKLAAMAIAFEVVAAASGL